MASINFRSMVVSMFQTSTRPGDQRPYQERLQDDPVPAGNDPLSDTASHPPFDRRAARFVLGTASATCALIVLDTNVVAVSLPSIARSFHAGFADVEWVVSSYMVAFASCLLPMGAMADRYGRKKMMIIGLGVFAIASLACGFAPTALFLNIARAVKGVGA